MAVTVALAWVLTIGSRSQTLPVGAAVPRASAPNILTVFIIVMENHSWDQIKGNAAAPYINNTLLPMASHAEQYFNPPGIHPSLPNYLWLEAGTNLGVVNDDPPDKNHQSTTSHLVTLLNKAGISWKSYQENISGKACPLEDNFPYAVRHNPFVYFDDLINTCTTHIRPFTELAADLAANTVAAYNFITPNVCHDMHGECMRDPILSGDTWLSENVPVILNSMAYQKGAFFITWDESEIHDGPIGLILLSPFAKGNGYQNSIHYTHSSTLRTMQEIFGVGPLLGDAANATDLSDLFTAFPMFGEVFNAAGYQRTIQQASWFTIKGSSLSANTRTWTASDFVDGNLPTQLDGVSVTVNNKPAFISYVSPEQINAQAPTDGTVGTVNVQVTNNGVTSKTITTRLQNFSPAFFLWPGSYAVATHVDFSLAVKEDEFPSVSSVPAKPGEVIILWGTGFGPTKPSFPAGRLVPPDQIYALANTPTVTINGKVAQFLGGALTPNTASLYQITVRVPPGAPDGDLPAMVQIGGVTSPAGVLLTVKR